MKTRSPRQPLIPIGGVLFDYMALKQALVKSDTLGAKVAGDAFAISLSDEKMEAVLVNQAKLIASSDDLEEQREAFMALTRCNDNFCKRKSHQQDSPCTVLPDGFRQ